MAITSNTYTANGTNKLFSITFPYLVTSDINVYLNGILQTITTEYTFANATTVEFVTAPANGAVVLLDRSTDDSTLQATFFPGSSIKANDLNFNFDQVLYLSQETANSAANQSTAGLQTQITAATNTANAAVVTANAADATANGIAGTANTALTNANAAVVTANAANATAIAADATANAIAATANAALPKTGGTMTGVITYAAAQPRLVRGTSVNTTSGTSVDFTSIPSWVKKITVILYGVSTNGTSAVQIQLGDSGGVETTGYTGSVSVITGPNTCDIAAFTTGFVPLGDSAGATRSGLLTIANLASNVWIASGTFDEASTTVAGQAQGFKDLSATLDRVRITTINGTDTFDGGTVNIIYEG